MSGWEDKFAKSVFDNPGQGWQRAFKPLAWYWINSPAAHGDVLSSLQIFFTGRASQRRNQPGENIAQPSLNPSLGKFYFLT